MTTDHDTTEMDRAMAALGVREDLLSDAERQHLDEQGYLVMPGVVDGNWLSALRERFEALCEAEGERAGVEVHQEAGTRRLSDLVNKGDVFDALWTHPKLLAAVRHVLGRP
ncbi:MAG: phytanoyl-CoA dioxygenase family protein, partial [Phycisphaeraceae bacterium]